MLDLSVRIGDLELKNPLICASGTFGFGIELKGMVNFKHIGAIVTKTITATPRQGNLPPRIVETECGVINSIGLENPGVDDFIKNKLPQIIRLKIPFIVSVGGFSLREYESIVIKLDKIKDILALEMNFSCPNIRLKKMVAQSPLSVYRYTRRLRRLTSKTLIIKLTPEVTDIVKVAQAAQDAGADAVSLINTFFAMKIDIETMKPLLGNVYGGYSGKAIKPMGVYRVWQVARQLNIPVIGGGGVSNYIDVLEYIIAGARGVSIGTANLIYPDITEKILSGLKSFMKRYKIADLNQIRGAINENI